MGDELLGPVARLQIQRERLKGTGVYDPAPLLVVAEAALGPGGMVGRHAGGWVLDVHHAAHPAGRGGGRRALSIGFTGHYEKIRGRYGEVPDGIGGENIIVDRPGVLDEGHLAPALVIRTADGAEVEIGGWQAAAPCLEFTSFLLGVPPRRQAWAEELAADRDFLHHGTRGFVAGTGHLAGPVIIRPGDEVWVRR